MPFDLFKAVLAVGGACGAVNAVDEVAKKFIGPNDRERRAEEDARRDARRAARREARREARRYYD